jgi:hypothetical protein
MSMLLRIYVHVYSGNILLEWLYIWIAGCLPEFISNKYIGITCICMYSYKLLIGSLREVLFHLKHVLLDINIGYCAEWC